jgi:hypothetical protein
VLIKENAALKLTLDNRDEQIERWNQLHSRADGSDGPDSGGLAAAEAERETLRDEIRGLHQSIEHKETMMARATGMLDAVVGVIAASSAIMVRHGGGHERLTEYLSQKFRREEQKRQREAAALVRSAEMTQSLALQALRRGHTQPAALAGMAEDVAQVLSLAMCAAVFPDSFYARISSQSKIDSKLGGRITDAKANSVEQTSTGVHGALFLGQEGFPYSLLVHRQPQPPCSIGSADRLSVFTGRTPLAG